MRYFEFIYIFAGFSVTTLSLKKQRITAFFRRCDPFYPPINANSAIPPGGFFLSLFLEVSLQTAWLSDICKELSVF